MSHLGRPRGKRDEQLSLAPVAFHLGSLVNKPVKFVKDCIGEEVRHKVSLLRNGEILVLENLRFYPGEEANDPVFARELASLGEIYVNDAFGAAHRAHASTVGVGEYFEVRAAGFLMEKELDALGKALDESRAAVRRDPRRREDQGQDQPHPVADGAGRRRSSSAAG